jgi:hypothetical protein
MSLHTAAKHLAKQGRGNDKMLVHMTPSEVKGLQAIAKAQGHELTINPETGLPEAGILEQVLPMLAAGAAIYFTGGLAAGALAPALGGTAAGILGGAGAGALIGGGMAAIQGGDVGNAALMGGVSGAVTGGMGGFGSGAEAANAGVGLDAAQNASMGMGANIPIDASNALTAAPTLNPTTGAMVDPLAMPQAPAGGYSGYTGTAASIPGPNTPTSALTPTANQISNLAPGQNVALNAAPPASPGVTNTPSPTSSASKGMFDGMSTGQKLALGATALGGVSLLDKGPSGQTPIDTSDDGDYLARISPNFKGQQPVQPNPYYKAKYPTYASGGITQVNPGPVQQMSQNMMGGQSNMYPQSQMVNTNFATPTQMPASAEVIRSDYGAKTDPYTGVMMASGGIASYAGDKGSAVKKKKKATYTSEAKIAASDPYEAGIARLGNAMYQSQMPQEVSKGLQPTMSLGDLNLAKGGKAHLGSYSDKGGRLLKGPGDGVSDDIPATIGDKQPARLADGEFVVPARIVSELGNGSTDAGAKKLYGMMDRIQKKRRKTKGIATNTKADRFLPA